MDAFAIKWRKSSRSSGQGGNCVEVALSNPIAARGGSGGPRRLVRDSKRPDDIVLAFCPAGWYDFLRAIKDGSLGS
ncbi:DUF397 domain-containing protein [Sphaerisporangium siamense]|uniref:DUF397 domain-containing protein n=1 Tax=Sphaerisporangium siamense TaxID=795645 RepID=UPI0016074A6D|nr:DUF397 domain-containing protein [Sphaerisporangium siamense]